MSHDSEVPIARSRHPTGAPSYLSKYHYSLIPFTILSFLLSFTATYFSTLYPISSILSYDSLVPHFQTYTLTYTLEHKSKNFKETMASKVWDNAVNVELNALEKKQNVGY